MDIMDREWSVREFCGLDLGDERLNRRLLGLAETFAAQREAPINQACADWQATSAARAPGSWRGSTATMRSSRSCSRLNASKRIMRYHGGSVSDDR
jgi:hypothetical protein